MKKILFLLLTAVFVVFSLISCNNNDLPEQADPKVQQPEVSTSKNNQPADNGVQPEQGDYYNTINIVIDGEAKYTAKYPNTVEITVFELLKKICEDQNINYQHLEGYVNSIADYNNTATEGWIYYFNGEMPDVGASDCVISKGFDNTLDFKYMKYSEAFPEE